MLEVIATKINYKEIYNLVKNLPTGKNVLTKPRGDFFYDPHILNEEYKGTEIEKLLDLIPMHGEARVIVMEPGQSYSAHADIDDRWHLTLDADESYLVDLQNEKITVTPHIAAASRPDTCVSSIVSNIIRYNSGEKLLGTVNVKKGY